MANLWHLVQILAKKKSQIQEASKRIASQIQTQKEGNKEKKTEQRWFYERLDKIDKYLVKLIKKKKVSTIQEKGKQYHHRSYIY